MSGGMVVVEDRRFAGLAERYEPVALDERGEVAVDPLRMGGSSIGPDRADVTFQIDSREVMRRVIDQVRIAPLDEGDLFSIGTPRQRALALLIVVVVRPT